MRAYRDILSIPGAWKFCAAGLLARSGGAMVGIGLVLMVSGLYGSYTVAGLLSAANGVSWAVGTAVLSNLVDRYGQRKIMYPSAVVSALALLVLVVMGIARVPAWTLVFPVIASGLTCGSPGALVRARWSHAITDPVRLHTAYALESTLDELTFVVGPVAATALSTGVHPAAGLVAPIFLALVGATVFYGQRSSEPPVHPREVVDGEHVPVWRRLILLVPGVAPVIVINLLVGCMFGAIDVSVVAATTAWDARTAAGLVLGAFSLASATAGFAYGAKLWKSAMTSRFVVGMLLMFVATAALLVARTPLVLAVAGVAFGATVAPTLINGNSLISRLVPQGRLTEGLSWMGTGIGIGTSIGSSVAGALIDSTGATAGLAAVTGFGAVAVAITLGSYLRLRAAFQAAEAGRLEV